MENRLKILMIDDDEQILLALQEVFQYQNWESLLARDVTAGRDLFRSEKPDLVLIDYHLPRINGVKGVRMLRELDHDVPIIVFTIDESQQVADEFIEAGASDFALKPIKVPDIISRIHLHIRLLESKRKLESWSHEQRPKGIGEETLELIEAYMKRSDEFWTVEEIAQATGLAQQTAYRYLQYLVSAERVEVRQCYGKVGRPKQKYRLRGRQDGGKVKE